MIDSDKLRPTLKAWQDTETAIVSDMQAADAEYHRSKCRPSLRIGIWPTNAQASMAMRNA